MTENIKESIRTLVMILTVVFSGIAGIWWGLRTGGAFMYLTGIDCRLLLTVLMTAGLIFQGYSNFKTNRKYNLLYRILLWGSGILIPVLIYGLMIMTAGDIAVLAGRAVLHVRNAESSYSCFGMLLFGVRPEKAAADYGLVWGSRVWNYENPALIGFFASAVITVCGIIHAQNVKITRYRATLPRPQTSGTSRESGHEPAAFQTGYAADGSVQSCRIVHLSDLHMGSIVGISYIRKVVRRTIELEPDYVVITGDLFNHGFVEELPHPEKAEAEFRKLNKACSGESWPRIFAIPGNHDPGPDDISFRRFTEKSHMTLLYDETVELPLFRLAGRGSNHVNHRPPLSSWLSVSEDTRPTVLLDHYPDGVREAQKEGVGLILSGHTHDGQYFPCNLLIRRRYPHGLAHGWSEWGQTKSIVSCGTGFFQIPIRVGTASEIVCIDLKI